MSPSRSLHDTHSYEAKVKRAASLIRSARSAVALTGAGVSTPSGVPDFRSGGTGLWEKYDPMEVASLSAFRYHPERFYAWIRPMARKVGKAEPNPAHYALAELEHAGYLRGVITQNIDGLHTRSGTRNILEIHGHFRQSTCVSCYSHFPTEGMLESFVESGEVPACDLCGGVLKPDMVLFGEQLPLDIVRQAQRWIDECDLLLVAGSSLEVTPVALFPSRALSSGAKLIIVNHEPTYIDSRASVVIHRDVADVLPSIALEVTHE